MSRFCARYPAIEIELHLTNEVVDLVAEGYDIAFRISLARLKDSSLAAQRIAPVNLQLYASPHYLARTGTPRTPAELESHEHVLFRGLRRLKLASDGENARADVTGRIACDDMFFAREAARKGAGIAILPTFLADGDLSAGLLVRVLPKWKIKGGDLWIVTPSTKHLPKKLAAFRDFVLEAPVR